MPPTNSFEQMSLRGNEAKTGKESGANVSRWKRSHKKLGPPNSPLFDAISKREKRDFETDGTLQCDQIPNRGKRMTKFASRHSGEKCSS